MPSRSTTSPRSSPAATTPPAKPPTNTSTAGTSAPSSTAPSSASPNLPPDLPQKARVPHPSRSLRWVGSQVPNQPQRRCSCRCLSSSLSKELSFRPKLLALFASSAAEKSASPLQLQLSRRSLVISIFVPSMHRDKKRCHENYDETNAHHPHMHNNHPFFKTISDYSENGPRISAKTRGLLSPLAHHSQNGIAIAAFPHRTRK